MNLGKTIEKLRKQRKFKQAELAIESGISANYLSLLENNKKEPNLNTLKNIAEVLDVPLPIIFFLALDDSDVPQHKQEAFKVLSPAIQSMVNQFFMST